MPTNLDVNGIVYRYPLVGDDTWSDASNWAIAVTSGMLQKKGGAFTLTADVNFGASFGLVSAYFKSRSSNIAHAGAIRLSNTDEIRIRNRTNTGDNILKSDPTDDDNLLWNGTPLGSGGGGGSAQWKDPVALVAALPASSNTLGDQRVITASGSIYNATSATTWGKTQNFGLIDPRDYGLIMGDSSANLAANNAAIAASIAAATTARTGIFLPPGVMSISASFALDSVTGLILQGIGNSPDTSAGSCVRWYGNSSDPVFKFTDTRGVVCKDFSVHTGVALADCGFYLENGASSSVVPTEMIFMNVSVNSVNVQTQRFDKGWRFVTGAGGDNNNDRATFICTQVNGFQTTAYSFESSQSKAHWFFGAQFNGGNQARAQVHATFDYDVRTAGDSVTIDGVTLTEGVEWSWTTNDHASAVSFNAAIIANSTLSASYISEALGADVYVYYKQKGTSGNGKTISRIAGNPSAIILSSSTLSGGYGAKYGVSTYTGGTPEGGSYHWYGGHGGSCTEADFYVGNPNDSISIDGFHSESSARFIFADGGTSTGIFPFSATNCRWDAGSACLATDKRAVDFRRAGPFLMRNCRLEADSAYPEPMSIRFTQSNTANYSSIIFENNHFDSTLANPISLTGTVGRAKIYNNRVNNELAVTESFAPDFEIWTPLLQPTGFTGIIQYPNNRGPSWINNAGTNEILLKVNTSDRLTYGGGVLRPTTLGTFTLANAATTAVTQAATSASSMIKFTPTNASAATLMGSAASLYVSARTASTSFTVATADGSSAAGTETFMYELTD